MKNPLRLCWELWAVSTPVSHTSDVYGVPLDLVPLFTLQFAQLHLAHL